MNTVFGECKKHFDKLANKINADVIKQDKCCECGEEWQWKDGQWRQFCTCGMVIVRDIKTSLAKEKEPACWLCMDSGFIDYRVQKDDSAGEYVCGCVCGSNNNKGIPKLTEAMYAPSKEYIYTRNRKNWEELKKKS
jgi:hypothetical protein